MAKIVVLACDKCGSQVDVQTFEVKQADKRAKVDLCAEHGAPLTELLGTAPTRKRTTRGPRGPKNGVTSIEEIEKLKK